MLQTNNLEQQTKIVLVVDDTASMRDNLCNLLAIYQHQFFAARDGHEALAFLLSHPKIDLVISDIMMPKMDGLTLLREIRKHYTRSQLPVILISGQLDRSLKQQALAYGASGFFNKPFDVTEFMSTVNAQLASTGGGTCFSNQASPS